LQKNTRPSDVCIRAFSYTKDSKRETKREPETQAITIYRKDGIPMMNNIYNLEQRMHEEVAHRAAGAKRRDLSRRAVVRTAPVVATRIVLRFGRLVITWA